MVEFNAPTIASILSISVFAVFGTLLRIIMGISFGTYCEEPELYRDSWLIGNSDEPDDEDVPNAFCVTTSGISDQYGGALFIDLPANILGSFLMGLLQSGPALGIPSDVNVAFLPSNNFFQKFVSLHVGLRTGLCGSLTTFSSWNTQMVVMIVGVAAEHGSQGMSAFFGYMIGLMAACAAYVFGNHVAIFFHRHMNKAHAKEEDMVAEQKSKDGTIPMDSYHFYENLSDFERHYLQDILDTDEIEVVREEFPSLIASIEQWKRSTHFNRNREFSLRRELYEIESSIINEKDFIIDDILEGLTEKQRSTVLAWDIPILRQYVNEKKSMTATVKTRMVIYGITFNGMLLFVILLFFLLGLTSAKDENGDEDIGLNQMLCISSIFAPFGALLRWRLSSLNNGSTMPSKWYWFPLGTFTANMIASIISISMQTSLSNLIDEPEFDFTWKTLIIKGIQAGFAGSLSTVSTFVAETIALMASLPKELHAYTYSFGSLLTACFLSTMIYSSFVGDNFD